MNRNILITSVGQRVVLTEIFKQSVNDLGLNSKVFSTDMNPAFAPAGYVSDYCFKVCRCTDEAYIPSLLSICQDKGVGMIIPTIDTELPVLSRNRTRFEERGIHVVVSDSNFVDICRDKRKTEVFMEQVGIDVPRRIDICHPSFPIFAKPYDGSLSTNLHIIKNENDLTPEILADPKLIFMEYIDKTEFKEYTVDMYYGRDHHVKGIVPRERIKVRAGEINKGITRKNYLVEFLKHRLDYIDGVEGCICIQLFFRESDKKVYGIEINPRFGGGYPLSFYSKANYPKYLLRESFLNEQIEYSDNWLENTLMLRYDRDIIVYGA